MPDRQYVYWSQVSQARGGDVFFCATPIDIAKELQQRFFKKVETVILTSATLSVMGSFDFFTESVGIGSDVEGNHCAGRIRYQATMRSCLSPPTSPSRTGEPPNGAVIEMIGRLLSLSRGRALVLFTSVRNMEAAYAALKDAIPMRVMIQGDAPRGALLAEFQGRHLLGVVCHGVLLGRDRRAGGGALTGDHR